MGESGIFGDILPFLPDPETSLCGEKEERLFTRYRIATRTLLGGNGNSGRGMLQAGYYGVWPLTHAGNRVKDGVAQIIERSVVLDAYVGQFHASGNIEGVRP